MSAPRARSSGRAFSPRWHGAGQRSRDPIGSPPLRRAWRCGGCCWATISKRTSSRHGRTSDASAPSMGVGPGMFARREHSDGGGGFGAHSLPGGCGSLRRLRRAGYQIRTRPGRRRSPRRSREPQSAPAAVRASTQPYLYYATRRTRCVRSQATIARALLLARVVAAAKGREATFRSALSELGV